MSNAPIQSAEKQLTQPVQFLKGVGPHRAELLEKLGIRTAADLLFFFPRKYQDFTELNLITELANEQLANLVGVVDDIDQMVAASGTHILYVLIKQDRQYLRAVWFNQPFMSGRFKIGQRVLFRGKAKLVGGRFQMNHPNVTWLDGENEAEQEKRLEPIYSLTDGVNQRQMRLLVEQVVEDFSGLVEEAFSDAFTRSLFGL